MVQIPNKAILLSRSVFIKIMSFRRNSTEFLKENSSCCTKTAVHRQTFEHIRSVQAEYQLRGWMR